VLIAKLKELNFSSPDRLKNIACLSEEIEMTKTGEGGEVHLWIFRERLRISSQRKDKKKRNLTRLFGLIIIIVSNEWI
jgi:hypothetical protein